MGMLYDALNNQLIEFIEAQKIFFVGTATENRRVNVLPKDMNSLRVLSNSRLDWLNVTGSGNKSSAHIQQNSP